MIALDKFVHDEVTNNGYTADYKKLHAWGYITQSPRLQLVSFIEFQSPKKDWGIQTRYATPLKENKLPYSNEEIREYFELDIAEFVLSHPELNEEGAYE